MSPAVVNPNGAAIVSIAVQTLDNEGVVFRIPLPIAVGRNDIRNGQLANVLFHRKLACGGPGTRRHHRDQYFIVTLLRRLEHGARTHNLILKGPLIGVVRLEQSFVREIQCHQVQGIVWADEAVAHYRVRRRQKVDLDVLGNLAVVEIPPGHGYRQGHDRVLGQPIHRDVGPVATDQVSGRPIVGVIEAGLLVQYIAKQFHRRATVSGRLSNRNLGAVDHGNFNFVGVGAAKIVGGRVRVSARVHRHNGHIIAVFAFVVNIRSVPRSAVAIHAKHRRKDDGFRVQFRIKVDVPLEDVAVVCCPAVTHFNFPCSVQWTSF